MRLARAAASLEGDYGKGDIDGLVALSRYESEVLGKLLRVRHDSPHMSLVVRRVTRALFFCEERRESGFPIRCLDHHPM